MKKILELYHSIKQIFGKAYNDGKYFAIGGSVVLHMFKLITRPPGDLDMMVSEKAEYFVKWATELAKIQKIKDGSYYYVDGNAELGILKHLKIRLNDINICIFVATDELFNKETVISNNVRMVTPKFIIKAKEHYIESLPKAHGSYKKHLRDLTNIKNRQRVDIVL